MNKIVKLAMLFALVSLGFCVHAQQTNMRYYEELVSNLTKQVKFLQEENAQLSARVTEIGRQNERISAENRAMRAEMEQIRAELKADAAQRDKQERELAAKLDAISKIKFTPPPEPPKPPTPPKSTTKKADPEPDENVKYEEYEVQSGATLSTIAKAYNVTVNDIKRANNMKNDKLRVGQKLLIPIK